MTDAREKIGQLVQGESGRVEPWALDRAEDILAALPDIMRGMVKPLVWEGAETDCFLVCELDGQRYELCVFDTLERSCDYSWSVAHYVGHQKTPVMCGKPATFEAAKAAAEAHHVSQAMAVFEEGQADG